MKQLCMLKKNADLLPFFTSNNVYQIFLYLIICKIFLQLSLRIFQITYICTCNKTPLWIEPYNYFHIANLFFFVSILHVHMVPMLHVFIRFLLGHVFPKYIYFVFLPLFRHVDSTLLFYQLMYQKNSSFETVSFSNFIHHMKYKNNLSVNSWCTAKITLP